MSILEGWNKQFEPLGKRYRMGNSAFCCQYFLQVYLQVSQLGRPGRERPGGV